MINGFIPNSGFRGRARNRGLGAALSQLGQQLWQQKLYNDEETRRQKMLDDQQQWQTDERRFAAEEARKLLTLRGEMERANQQHGFELTHPVAWKGGKLSVPGGFSIDTPEIRYGTHLYDQMMRAQEKPWSADTDVQILRERELQKRGLGVYRPQPAGGGSGGGGPASRWTYDVNGDGKIGEDEVLTSDDMELVIRGGARPWGDPDRMTGNVESGLFEALLPSVDQRTGAQNYGGLSAEQFNIVKKSKAFGQIRAKATELYLSGKDPVTAVQSAYELLFNPKQEQQAPVSSLGAQMGAAATIPAAADTLNRRPSWLTEAR